ncbi:hypothetical protein N8000_05875 [Rhodospirillales bacterium]|nr:hypothetical protein [Rhodospirillales bacterium]
MTNSFGIGEQRLIEIVILGVTSYPEIRQIIADMNTSDDGSKLKLVAFLDDNESLHGQMFDGAEVAGGLDKWGDFPDAHFVFAIGSHRSRMVRHNLLDRLSIPIERYISLIHPQAMIFDDVKVGAGVIIHSGVTIMGETQIGNFVIAMPQVLVQGRCDIADGAMLAPGACIGNDTNIGPYCHIGMRSIVAPMVKVGLGAQVLTGSLVGNDVGPGIICGGNPARSISREVLPEELKNMI